MPDGGGWEMAVTILTKAKDPWMYGASRLGRSMETGTHGTSAAGRSYAPLAAAPVAGEFAVRLTASSTFPTSDTIA